MAPQKISAPFSPLLARQRSSDWSDDAGLGGDEIGDAQECGLRDAAPFGCLAEMPQLSEGDEILKLAKRHHAPSAMLMGCSMQIS